MDAKKALEALACAPTISGTSEINGATWQNWQWGMPGSKEVRMTAVDGKVTIKSQSGL